jgi:hypothetical protein
MKYQKFLPIMIVVLFLNLIVAACSPAATSVPTAASTATVTPVPPTPTKTAKPTSTPRPTATPNVAATQQIEDFNATLKSYMDQGYIASMDGEIAQYDDFNQDWAQIGWYQWLPLQDTKTDFVFKGRISWSAASDTPEISGCGIVFGLQENRDHYGVFIDKSRILFLMGRGSKVYNVGKTSGSGRLNFGNPAEADLIIAVKGQTAYVSVDGDVTQYTLSEDQTTKGKFALSVLSGTNKDYGTNCKMTDLLLWTAK